MPSTPFIFSTLVAAASTVIAAEPLPPSGQWIVDFADAQCVAARDYGRGDGGMRLLLKAPARGGVVQLAVLTRQGAAVANQAGATFAADDSAPVKMNMLVYSPKDSEWRVHLLNIPEAEFARVRQAKSIAIQSSRLDQRFALSGMPALLKVVDECVADLRRAWNVPSAEDAAPAALERRASTNLPRLFSSSDYPAVALDRDQTGRVRFTLLVDEKGRVADCTLIETSGVAALDAQTCALIKERAKFRPALGKDGKPARDSVVSAVTWRIAP